MEVDSCYINEGVVKRITNKIIHISDQKGQSIGVDAPIGYGKSEVAKAIVNYFEEKEEYHIIPVYIKCDQYDFDVSLENTISACLEPLLKYIKKREEAYVNWDKVKESLTMISKAIIELDPKVSAVARATQELFHADSADSFENEKMKNMNSLTKGIHDILLADKKYIFIFDNLDICNPSFSLKMFDTIKFVLSHLKRNVNFLIFIDFEYLTLLHEGLFAKNVSLQYYYRQMFDDIIKMDLKKRSDFFEDKLNAKIKGFYDINPELKNMFISINETNKVPLRTLEITIKELENLIENNSFYLFNENLWILHTLYSFIVMNNVYIKRFNKIVYDNISTEHIEIDDIISFYKPEYYELFFSNRPFINGNLRYYDGYSSIEFDCYNTCFEKKDTEILVLKKDTSSMMDSVPVESFCLCGDLNLEETEEFVGIFTYDDILENDILKLQEMTFKDYVKYKINNNY